MTKANCSYCKKSLDKQLFIFSIGERRYHPKCWYIVAERLDEFIDKLRLTDDEFEKWLTEDEAKDEATI